MPDVCLLSSIAEIERQFIIPKEREGVFINLLKRTARKYSFYLLTNEGKRNII